MCHDGCAKEQHGAFGLLSTCMALSNSGGSNTALTLPFATYSVGTGNGAAFVSPNTITPSSGEISSIVFGTGPSGTNQTESGVYRGTYSGTYNYFVTAAAATPFGASNVTTNFMVAGGNGGTVTISYSVTQTQTEILWGSVDNGTTANVMTFKNGSQTVATITGQQVAALVTSGFVSGTTNVALKVSNLPGYNSIVFSDASTPAFEFAIVNPVTEPVSLMVLGIGTAGIAMVRRRKALSRARREPA